MPKVSGRCLSNTITAVLEYHHEGLTTSFSLPNRFGLANGSAVRYHSVSMETDEENDLLRLRMNSCRPGTVLTISRPYSLNVELALDPSWATKFESHLPEVGRDGLPCISGRDPIANVATSAIVPILHSARNAEWHTRSIFGDRCRGYPPSRVHVRDYIRAEMGFAVTIHKAGTSHNCIIFVYLVSCCLTI